MTYRRISFSLALCLALGAGARAQESQRGERGSRGGGGNNRPRATAPAPRPARAPSAARQAPPAPRAPAVAPRANLRPPTPPSASRGRSTFPTRGRTTALPERRSPFPGATTRPGTTVDPRSRSGSGDARSTPGTQFLRPGADGWSGARRSGDDARPGRTVHEPSRGTTPSRAPAPTGFTRPAPARTPNVESGGRVDRTGFARRPAPAAQRSDGHPSGGRHSADRARDDHTRRYGLTPRPTRVYRSTSSYHHGSRNYCSPYYSSGSFYLGFTFGIGSYCGLRYYYPWYHYGSHYAFFYSSPLSYCYVPYGFYCDAPATYVTRYVYVQDTYPTTEYQVIETAAPETDPVAGQEVVEPLPAAGSPVAEKYLRDGSDLFREGEYLEAAKLFRLAALSTPDNAAPYFAFSQALIGIRSDAYAARVLRKAVLLNPDLVREPGDIVGVFKDQAEFERVMGELAVRADLSPAGSDARFLLAAEQYFSGDPKAVEGFRALHAVLPGDEVVAIFDAAAATRFAAAEELPPVATQPK